jgi:hypothetical protein
VNWSRDDTITAYNCVAAVMRGFRTAPAPWAVTDLYDRLDAEVRMSQSGRECGCGGEESEQDKLISSREAAAILGFTKRHVNRIAESLGGEFVDRRWLFRESVVRQYAEGRNERAGSGR